MLHTNRLAYCFIGRNTSLLYSCCMNEETVQMNLKVPASLRDKLREAADKNHRSMTAELVARVSQSFDDEPMEDRVFELEERVDMLESFIKRAFPDHF